MIQRERCPTDGGKLWYGTDWLGRVAGICGTCGTRYARFAEVVAPKLPPVRPVVLSSEHKEVAGLITAHLRAYPGAMRMELHAALAPMSGHRIDRVLTRMLAFGEILRVSSGRSTEASSNSNKGRGRRHYLADQAPPPATMPRLIPEMVLDVLTQSGKEMSVAAIAEATSEACYSVRRSLRSLQDKNRVLHRNETTQRRGRLIKETLWRLATTPQTLPDWE